MRVRPLTPAALTGELVARIDRLDLPWVRVGVDGAPPAEPAVLASALVDPLRARGRYSLHVPAGGFLRPASLRYERGRADPDAFYEDWLDAGALNREVLGPLGAAGTGRVLPSRWNPVTDRATRASYVDIPAGGVVVVSGSLLLGVGLDFDLTVHLAQSPAALARRTALDLAWTLPAYERYREEAVPDLLADIVVRADDPRHPALVER